MRKLNLLKSVIDLFSLLATIATMGMIIIVPILMVEKDFPIAISGKPVVTGSWQADAVLVLGLAGAIAFLYGVYQMRKIVSLFQKRTIFSHEVVVLFRRCGYAFLISIALTEVPRFAYKWWKRPEVGLDFSNGGFGSFLFSVALGLFFLVLSEVFRIAKGMKDENELTV